MNWLEGLLVGLGALITGVLGVVAVMYLAQLTWSTVSQWFTQHKDTDSDYGLVIKESLASGKFRVIAGVFNRQGTTTAKQAWETNNLDSDLQTRFGNSDRIRVSL